jgi:tryptophan synthase alpha chain
MNRIDTLFQTKKNNILSVYFTAGYPSINDTIPIIEALESEGADMVEIGMPFSDPVADGLIIQQSSQKALNNGMSLKVLFDQISNIRAKVKIPLLLMGYLNPVYRYGVEKFCKKCREIGIDGIILPDLPLMEYDEMYHTIFEENNLYFIFFITPQTSDDRIKKICMASKGFIYMVSSYSTTGSGKGLEQSKEYFQRMQAMNLQIPRLVGFGIKDKTTFDNACQYAQGAIIGTAFIKALEKEGNIKEKVKKFIENIKVG